MGCMVGKGWFKDLFTLLNSTVVYRLMTLTVIVYFLQLMGLPGMFLTAWGALIPEMLLRGQVWRLMTYGFLHDASLFHVAFNMLGLWFFGRELEELWGSKKFLIFYLFAILFSGLFGLLNIPLGHGGIPIIGASGAVYGVLLAYAVLFPGRELLLYFMIRIPVRVAVFLLTLVSLAGFLGRADGIAHLVHLGGFAAGWVFLHFGDTLMAPFEKKGRVGRKKGETAVLYDFKKKDEPMVDDILRKIHAKGMKSLTKREREILEEYSRR